MSNGTVCLTLRIGYSIHTSVWYLIDTVSLCWWLSTLTYCVLSPWSATVETVMSHGSHLKATLKAILTYGHGELLCGGGAKLWATVGLVLGLRPFRELRNIDIDPLSSWPPLLKIILAISNDLTKLITWLTLKKMSLIIKRNWLIDWLIDFPLFKKLSYSWD